MTIVSPPQIGIDPAADATMRRLWDDLCNPKMEVNNLDDYSSLKTWDTFARECLSIYLHGGSQAVQAHIGKMLMSEHPTDKDIVKFLSSQTKSSDQEEKRLSGFITLQELFARPTPRIILGGYLYEHETALLIADEGLGKTFLGVDWSVCVAMGIPWHDHQVMPGKVVYVAAEGAHGHVKRLSALMKAYHITLEQLAANFVFYEHPIDLLNNADVSAFTEEARTLIGDSPTSLLVIDTLSQCVAGANENDNGLMSKAIGNIEKIRRALDIRSGLILHHDLKNGGNGKGRGASSIGNNLPARFQLTYGEGQECEREPQIKLAVLKCRDDEKSAPLWLQRTVVDTGIWSNERMAYLTSCRLLPIDRTPMSYERLQAEADQEVMLAILKEHMRLSTNKWRSISRERGVSERTFDKHLPALKARHAVIEQPAIKQGAATYYTLPSTSEQSELTTPETSDDKVGVTS